MAVVLNIPAFPPWLCKDVGEVMAPSAVCTLWWRLAWPMPSGRKRHMTRFQCFVPWVFREGAKVCRFPIGYSATKVECSNLARVGHLSFYFGWSRESCSESEEDPHSLSWTHKPELKDSLVDMYKGTFQLYWVMLFSFLSCSALYFLPWFFMHYKLLVD